MSPGASQRSEWSLRGAARALVMGALAWAVGASLGYVLTHRPTQSASRPSTSAHAAPVPAPEVSAAELALLAPLTRGAVFEGWTVSAIEPVTEGSLRLHLSRDAQRVDLQVGLLGPGAPSAPASAGPYGVFYSTRGAPGESAAVALAVALGHVLERNLAVPVPPGMARFGGAPAAH